MNPLNILFDASVKSLLALGLVALAMPLLRRGSAAMRHFVWALSLVGLLALPALSAALPGWRVLPNWTRPQPPIAAASLLTLANADAKVAAAALRQPAPSSPSPAPAPSRAPLTWVGAIWLGGMCLSLTPLLIALRSLRRLERNAAVVTTDAWLDLTDSCRRRLKLNGAVVLLRSSERQMPMTWGLRRARVLLPDEAGAWTSQRRELALLHELAHVKRRDSLVNCLAQIVCALYWFNPLVWIAARKMRAEREQACDDLVLTSGSDAGDYAEELLEMATTFDPAPFAGVAASPMARRSTLEGRLLAILDRGRNRATLTAPKVTGAIALLAAILIPISMLRGTSAQAQTAAISATSGNDETIAQTYTVKDGGTLLIDVDAGDIEIAGTAGDKVDITVLRTVKHANAAAAANLLKEHPVTLEQTGADVIIRAKGPEVDLGSWFGAKPSLSTRYRVTTPRNTTSTFPRAAATLRSRTSPAKPPAAPAAATSKSNICKARSPRTPAAGI